MTSCHCVRQCFSFFQGPEAGCDNLSRREEEKVRVEAISSAINSKCECCTDLLSLMLKSLKLDVEDKKEDSCHKVNVESDSEDEKPLPYSAKKLLTLPSFISVLENFEGNSNSVVAESKVKEKEFEEWKKQQGVDSSTYFGASAPVVRTKTYQRLYSEWRKKKMSAIRAIIASQTRDFLGYLNLLADFSQFHGLEVEKEEDASLPRKLAYCLLREAREMSDFFVPYNLWDPEVGEYDKEHLAELRKEAKRKAGSEEEEEEVLRKKSKQEEVNKII